MDGKRIAVILEWSHRGVTKIKLADDSLFSGAKLDRSNSSENIPPTIKKEVSVLVNQLEKYFSGDLKKFTFNWFDDSNCTDFQKRVYRAAKKIPFGTTKTYSEIATTIQQPKAVRAVGTALGKNPWLLLVPCHRVKGKTGMGGFSAPGGIKTKLQLLSLES